MCRIDLFRKFPVIDDVTTSRTLTYSHTLILTSVSGNGTYFLRDSFVHQRGTPVKIFLKMRILASSFQWGVWQVLRGLRFWDICVQSFQIYSWTFAIFSTFWSFIIKNHNTNLSDHHQHSYLTGERKVGTAGTGGTWQKPIALLKTWQVNFRRWQNLSCVW